MIVIAGGSVRACRRWRQALARHASVVDVRDASRLRHLLATQQPPVVLLDLALAGLGGLAGARGYAPVELAAALVAPAVEVVQKGELWASRALVARVLDEVGALADRQDPVAAGVDGADRLTRREREVARLVAAGASNRDVARQANLSEKTVKAHLTAVFRKLKVRDRLRLALLLNARRSPL